jgi:microcompartment protein CcmK/EutM
MYAYLYAELSKLGIENIGASQLVGYPTQYPSVSMVDWVTGRPNARFRVLELLKHNFGPGDKLVSTRVAGQDVSAQGYRTVAGRKLLLVNKRDAAVSVNLPAEAAGGRMDVVDATTGENPARSSTLSGTRVVLAPFAVAVVSTVAP